MDLMKCLSKSDQQASAAPCRGAALWVVYWCIDGKLGHGSPITSLLAAQAWCDRGNTEWGAGTHWVGEA